MQSKKSDGRSGQDKGMMLNGENGRSQPVAVAQDNRDGDRGKR